MGKRRRSLPARGSRSARKRSQPPVVSQTAVAGELPARHERADSRLERTAYKTLDARSMARRNRPTATDARFARPFGELAGTGRARGTTRLRGGQARSTNEGR